jgi:DNA-binding HxlR family transcriptional regulator
MGAGMQTVTEPGEEPAVHAPPGEQRSPCCALYHHAVELVGKRWTGAILLVLMDGPLRFSEIRQLVPDVSDRLLSERLKELEAEEVVERRVFDETPVRVEYGLTAKGQALEPALMALKSWSHAHCDGAALARANGSARDCR